MRVGRGDIGRVGDEGVQAGRGQGGKPVGSDHPGVVGRMVGEIVRRHRHRARAEVNGDEGPGRPFQGQGQGDGAAASAGIRNQQGCVRRQEFQGDLH